MRFCLFLSFFLAAAAGASPLEDAVALYKNRNYAEARAAFEKLAAADPHNAEACHYLGLTLRINGDVAALNEALAWIEKAIQLEPDNATFLADYGGISLLLADKTRSYKAAARGRDAMEKAVALDPENLDAREGLMQFYARAPWPLGSSKKSNAQLDEIRKRDPDRAAALSIQRKASAKDFAGAFALCEELLAKQPDNYVALYQYGRTATVSGQNLERGLASLQRCLALTPPSPASPQPTHVWKRIGDTQEKLGRLAEAIAAYETALKLDPDNKPAATALGRLK